MTAHVHAALMAEYAKDAAETETPWERWQFKNPIGGEWVTPATPFIFWETLQYRRKPTTIKLPAKELPGSMRTAPADGTLCWALDMYAIGSPEKRVDFYANEFCWHGVAGNIQVLEAGQLFTTREACQAWADYFNAALKGEVHG